MLGCKQPSIAEWFDKGEVPEGRQYQLELATGGVLKANKPANRNPADEEPAAGKSTPSSDRDHAKAAKKAAREKGADDSRYSISRDRGKADRRSDGKPSNRKGR